jgi:hypothetical protein
MPPGIGASGIAGIAIEKLAPPTNFAGVPQAGGALTAGTYKYYITAINASGETTVSSEVTVTTAAADLTAHLTWDAVTGATGYKIYRTAAGGATGTQLLLTTLGLVTVYDDAAVGSPSGAFPTYNTAYAPGTYTAPTKFFPFMSESITMNEQTVFRRPIRSSADIIGAVAGNENPEGDMSLEALEDVVLYWLFASRTSIVKTGSNPNFTYTITPTAAAIPLVTLSLTVVRNGIVFGFTGVTLSSFTFTVEEGLLMFNTNIIARDEATQSTPVPTWTTTVPFGAGTYSVEIPTGSAVLDTDTFEWTVEDNAEAQFRLRSGTRGATFVKFGERNSTISLERDFESRTDFDAFKAVTSQSITISATKGANNSISLLTPVAIKDTYEVANSGQGDLVRAAIAYQNVIDGTGKSWQIVIKCQEDLIST